MRLNYLRFWIIAACILLIIIASAFLFLGYKSDKTAYIKNYTDSLFISTYTPRVNSVPVDVSQPIGNKPIVKDTIAIKKFDAPVKPASPTNSDDLKNSPEVKKKQAIQRNHRIEEVDDDRSSYEDGDIDYHPQGSYSLSNSEIQSLLAGNVPDEKIEPIEKPENPIVIKDPVRQTSRPVAGVRAFNDYVQKNRHSITDEDCANQHGKVILFFRVDKGGHPVDIVVFRSLCHAADKEAIRLLQNGPAWAASGDNFTRWEVTF